MVVDLLLVAGAGIGFAILDLLRKKLSTRVRLVPLLFWLSASVLPIYAVWCLLAAPATIEARYWAPAVGSLVLNVGANLLYLRAVQVGELSRTIPLLSLTPVLTAIVAVPLLGEVPSSSQLVGILLVVIGALLLQRSGKAAPETERASRLMGLPASAWLMLSVAALWSATVAFDKLALEQASVPIHAFVLNAGIGIAMVVWLAARRELGTLGLPRETVPLVALASIVSALALGLQLLALEHVFAALLETLKRGVGGFAALVLGRWFFAEPLSIAKALAVAIMVVGIALLVF